MTDREVRTGADGDSVSTDGGTVTSPFEVVSEYEETRRDRLRKYYDSYVHAPFAIIARDWRARIGFSIVLLYLFAGIFGVHLVNEIRVGGTPFIQPMEGWDWTQPLATFPEYPLGTDRMGADLLSQVVISTSEMLKMMAAGATFTVVMGTSVGAMAGYKGGAVDTVLSSITDIFLNLPGLPTVMVLAMLLDLTGNPYLIGCILVIAHWGGLARMIRSQVLTLRQESFTEAARAMGVPSHHIVFKEIVPHLMPYVVINMANTARYVIFQAAGLYFLGVLPYANHNWGVTLNSAYTNNAHIRPDALHWFLVPMVAIGLISIGLTLLGQSLDRVFNPRVRARHEKKHADSDDEAGEPEPTTTMGNV